VVAEAYSIERGYLCEAFKCEKCAGFHIRQSQVPREIPEEDRWSPARHRANRARIKAESAARRAEEEEKMAVARAVKEGTPRRPPAKKKEIVRCRVLRPKVCKSRSQCDKEKRDRWRNAGLCTQCGAVRVNPRWLLCEECRAYNRTTGRRQSATERAVAS